MVYKASSSRPSCLYPLRTAVLCRKVFGIGDEDPVELQEKRKTTMFTLLKSTSERAVQRDMHQVGIFHLSGSALMTYPMPDRMVCLMRTAQMSGTMPVRHTCATKMGMGVARTGEVTQTAGTARPT